MKEIKIENKLYEELLKKKDADEDWNFFFRQMLFSVNQHQETIKAFHKSYREYIELFDEFERFIRLNRARGRA